MTGSKNKTDPTTEILIQTPSLQDATSLYRLISRSKPLDVNSEYLYMLLGHHFRETCAVAFSGEEMAGAVTGYRPPGDEETFFAWQVAVDKNFRKRGLALSMLKHILSRQACQKVRFIEATVSPSNRASLNLFRSLAAEFQTEFREFEFLTESMFLKSGHEAENLIRVGPIKREALK